jgi:hypothetical protein
MVQSSAVIYGTLPLYRPQKVLNKTQPMQQVKPAVPLHSTEHMMGKCTGMSILNTALTV